MPVASSSALACLAFNLIISTSAPFIWNSGVPASSSLASTASSAGDIRCLAYWIGLIVVSRLGGGRSAHREKH
jgi:hypothetical protein